jgi:uncharacterized Zn finger protein/DNA-binding XRE family transcriptional regulator
MCAGYSRHGGYGRGRRGYGGYGDHGFFEWRPKVDKKRYIKDNLDLNPVVINGTRIAKTFWGERWCDHFESMADYANRIPRGRTYARNGSVVDLKIDAGKIEALVLGSDAYKVEMTVKPLPQDKWEVIKKKCQGGIATMVDLLMGRFSPEIMEVLCDPEIGMFPKKSEISHKCSCPDVASLCKHVSAVFLGIGNRLDHSPELLFLLRRVNPMELFEGSAERFCEERRIQSPDLLEGDLSNIFGVDIASDDAPKEKPLPAASKAGKVAMVAKGAKSSPAPKTIDNPADNRLSDAELKKIVARIAEDKKGKPFTVKSSGMKPDFDNITGPDFIKLRKYCQMTTEEIAKATGISSCCVRRWEKLPDKINAASRTKDKLKAWWEKMP